MAEQIYGGTTPGTLQDCYSQLPQQLATRTIMNSLPKNWLILVEGYAKNATTTMIIILQISLSASRKPSIFSSCQLIYIAKIFDTQSH